MGKTRIQKGQNVKTFTGAIQIPSDVDPFDPNNWEPSRHEFRIYGDDNAGIFAIVDEEDYHFLIRHRWSPKFSKNRRKCYLRRNVQDDIEPEGERYFCHETGKIKRNRKRVQRTLFLHTVVMLRSGIPQPSEDHHIPDHINGKEWDCRRLNLRWATHSMNSKNIFGVASKQTSMFEGASL
jgi:hypothetical protein